mgnify:CR=1 FL=1
MSLLRERSKIKTELAERRLYKFVEQVWPTVEPTTPFQAGWHIEAVCDHLEGLAKRQIRNLLILIPPRHTKSLTSSVCFNPWLWIREPSSRFMYASYSGGLSTEHAVLSRRVIESDWYQERWGSIFKLTTDQNIKTYYENTKRGYRISTSVGGTVTGHGADFLGLDDPHNLEKIHSEVERINVYQFYKKVWHSRLNDPKTGCRFCIMQRGHQDDIAARMMGEFGYEVLMLPTEYDPKRSTVTSLGFKDPRTEAGELLCPERKGALEVAEDKRIKGRDFETQDNQNPQHEEGMMFKRSWFQIVDAMPVKGRVSTARFWDCAATEPRPGKDPDYTVGTKVSKFEDGLYYVEDVVRGRWSPRIVDETIYNTAAMDGRVVKVVEEQEPGASGKSVIANHTQMMAGFDYEGKAPSGAKTTRWRPFAVQCEAGNVRLKRAEWNQDWLQEMGTVPEARHDDQADSVAGAFEKVALGRKKARLADTQEM